MIGLITARKGSKSIKNKNITLLNGKPLINYTLEAGIESKLDSLFVTTDCPEVISICKKFDIEVIVRPHYLCSDEAKSIDVIKHFIETKQLSNKDICLLQPTSPLRNENHINKAIHKYRQFNSKHKSLVSVEEINHKYNPESIMIMESDTRLIYFDENKAESTLRRQEKKKYYARNGAAIYIFNSENINEKSKSLLSGNIIPFKMERFESIDIDDETDLFIAQAIIHKKYNLR